MAMKKLPCEYKELGIARAKRLFEGWSEEQKIHFVKAMEKCANHFERTRYSGRNNPHTIKTNERRKPKNS